MYNRNHRQTTQRYNSPGQFVSAGHLGQNESPARNTRSSNYQPNNQQPDYSSFANLYNQGSFNRKSQYETQETRASNIHAQQQQQSPQQQQQQQQQQQPQQQPQQQQPQQQQFTVEQQIQAQEEPAPPLPKEESMEEDRQAVEDSDAGDDSPKKPYWMKPRGIKKISNKERRRRQNEQLRRLLTPKNALMVLNEMLPGEQVNNQFIVEPSYNQPNQAHFFHPGKFAQQFCADLNLEGVQYKGYGENKVMARNNAAEQAIRDLVIKRMSKALTPPPIQPQEVENQAENGEGNENEEQTLPMIQLASYALHRLFVEWQADGFKVPLLNKVKESDTSSVGGDSDIQISPPLPKEPKPKKIKELPADAAQMHPCMLLSYMRAGLEYHDIGTEGDKPQNMLFTMGINVDGATYIGKASNKKEARKKAAASACKALFNIDFVWMCQVQLDIVKF